MADWRRGERRKIASRAGAAQAVERALRPLGFEGVIRGDEDEPVASYEIGPDHWVDVYVKDSPSARVF